MPVIYRRAGEVFSFPFSTKDQYGRLANVTTQGNFVLCSNDVFQCVVPEAAITFTNVRTGLYVAHVDSSNAELLTLVDETCFDDGNVISGGMESISADSVDDLGDWLPRTYVVGDAPDPSYPTVTGVFDIEVTVTNQATGLAVAGATVTFRSDLNYAAQSTPTSGIVTQAVPFGVWRVIVSLNGYSIDETTVTIEEEDDPLVVIEVAVELVSNAVLPPDSEDKLTGWFVAEDNLGNPAEGIDFEVRIVSTNTGSGVAPDASWVRATSAANGLVQWNSIVPGYTYHVRAANRRLPGAQFTAPELGDPSIVDDAFEIPEFRYVTE